MQTTSIKRMMHALNFVFVITGIVMVAVGATAKSHYYPYYTFLDDRYFSLPNMLIATGSLIFFIALLGTYGTASEKSNVLMAYSVLMIIIFIFELSASIAGYVLRDKTSTYIETTLYSKMKSYEKSDEISAMWDAIQEEFECCGVQNYSDWNSLFQNDLLPISCCKLKSGVVGAFYCNSFQQPVVTTEKPTTTEEKQTTTEEPSTTTEKQDQNAVYLEDSVSNTYPVSTTKPYSSGCHSLFSEFIKKYAVNIGAVGISFAILQLGGIFVSIYLARQLRNSYYST